MLHSKVETYDLCIVGAGMFGSAAARHASARMGVKICLIGPGEPKEDEMRTREIFGAHYDEGRITYTVENDLISHQLSKASILRYRELERVSGISFYDPVGCFTIGRKDGKFMKKMLQNLANYGLSLVDLSCGDLLKRRYPFLKFKVDDQVLLEDTGAGYISPRKMIAAQIKVAKDQGCVIIDDIVESVESSNPKMHLVHTKSGKNIHAKRILYCTGAFTNLKKPLVPELKMRLNKDTVSMLKVSSEEAARIRSMPSMLYIRPEDNLGAYILPPIKYPDGNTYLKIGHLDFENNENEIQNLEEAAQWYNSTGDTKKADALTKILTSILPRLKYQEVCSRACITCDNPTGIPYIDRLSPTVTVAVVGNGGGAKMSDEVGRIAATLSLTGQWDSDLDKSSFEAIFEDINTQ